MTPQFIGLFRTLLRVVVFCAFLFSSEHVFAQPDNDDPCGAEVLGVETACQWETYELTDATGTAGVTDPGCASYVDNDVWFVFTAPASGAVTIDSSPIDFTDSGMALYSGTCNALTLIECDDDDSVNGLMSSITANGLIPGVDYFIRFWEFGGGGTGDFDICVTSVTAAVCINCGNATVINGIPFSGAYTTCGACDDVQSGEGCGSFYLGGEDYLFSYTPTVTGAVNIDVFGALGWTGVFVTEGCPTAGGICLQQAESFGGNAVISGLNLTAGVTYFITIDTWPSPDCTPFTIDISTTQPPANDDPCSAINLPVNYACVSTTGTNAAATNSSVPDPPCGNYLGGDVWYQVTVPASGGFVIDTQTGDLFDAAMAVYTGSCGSLTLLDCDDDGSANGLMPSLTLNNLTPGQTLWIRVWSNGNAEIGEFGICATETLDCGTVDDNSTCGSAQPFCTGTSYSYCNTTGVPSLGGSGIYGCLGSTPNPAFYFLNVETAGPINFTITQTSLGGTGLDVDYVIWGPFANQGAMCGGLAASNIVSCSYSTAAIENATIPSALPGQWYMLLITNFSNQPGYVSFEQTNASSPGAGQTNCNILSVETPVCSGYTYTLEGSVLSTTPPSTGTLTITNSCASTPLVFSAPFPATLDFSFPDLCANGVNCAVSAVYSAGAPTLQPVFYTAPNCNTFTAVPSACSGGSYSVSGTLSAGCLPASGTLTISSSCGGTPVVYNAPFSNTINYTLTGLCGNGESCTVTAVFTDPSGPSILPATYTAPNCNTLSASASACVSGYFSISGNLYVPCPPSTGTLTISSSCGGSPVVYNAPFGTSINYSILNIPESFGVCSVTASFSAGGVTIPTASVNPPTCCSPLTVTVTPSAPTICTGGTGVVLTGTVPASGGNISFGNTADYAVPDAAAGIFGVDPISSGGTWAQSSVSVTGICPSTFTSSTFLQVCMNINHTWAGDLTIWLRAPSGHWVMLSQSNGGSANNYTNTCFTTVPGVNINVGTAPFTGSFNPEQAFTALAGATVNGTWTLYVGDYAGGDTGTLLDWTISFAQPTVTYTWSPTTALSSTTVLNPTANPTATTTYTLTANNSCGCTGSAQATVVVVSPPNAGTNGSVTVCSTGTPVNLFSYLGGSANSTGTWTGPSPLLGGYSGIYNPVTMNPGVYTYTVLGTSPCANATATVTVTEVSTPSPGTNGSVVACATGGNINLFNSLGGSPVTTGTWSGPSGLLGGYLGTFNPLTNSPGTYTYLVPGTAPCPPISATVSVTIVPGPTATISYPATPFCSNDADSNPTITGTTGGTFSASPVGLSINATTGAIQPTLSASGTYTVTYTIAASGGCPVFTTTTTVQILEPLQIYVTGTNPTCATSCDGTADALVTGGLAPYTYAWSGSGSTTATATGLCEGTYTATVTDAAGCVTSCSPVVPAGCFQIQGILVDACGLGSEEGLNEMVFLQVGSSPLATSGLTVTWATANTWQGLCTNPTFISNVNATITGGGSLIAAPATLPAGANVVLITSATTLSSTNLFTNLTGPLYVLFQCGSQTSGNFTNVTGTPGIKTLTMNFGGGCVDQVSYLNTSLTSNPATGDNGASVVYTSGGVPTYVNYGCSVPSSIQNCDVVLTAPPFDVVVSPTTSSICEGSSVELTATGADSYTWTPSASLSSATGAGVTATPTITTVYSVTGTTGPCSETETVTVTVETPPTATVVYDGSPFCSDISSPQVPSVTGSLGGTFSAVPAGLTLNATNGSINPSSSSPGTYIVTYIIPASGTCPASSTTTSVTITPAPLVPTLTPANPCSGSGVVFTAGNGSMFEFFINGVSQGPASTTNTFTSGILNGGDQVCVRSTPPVPFVMNGNINEPEWGAPITTSANGPLTSSFGLSNNIDALYLRNMNGQLYGAVAGNEHDGNDQANNNWILLFIDSKPGGYNNLSSWTNRSNVPSSTNGLLNLSLSQNVIFDAGFAPDYILCMNQASATAYFDLYDMQADMNTYLGSNVANPSKFGFIGNSGTGDYLHGFEFTFPLSQLGSPTTSIQAFAIMVNDPNSGVQTFLSNQFLSPAGQSESNYGNGSIDFNSALPNPVSFMLSADCFEETCVTVIPTVTPTFNAIPPLCYQDAAPILPTTSTNGVTGTWSPAVSNTASGVYTFTPSVGQCANSATLNITVYPETLTTPIYHD